MFLHPQIPDFQILSKPYINGDIIYSAFRWCINLNVVKLSLKTGFVLQGHIFPYITHILIFIFLCLLYSSYLVHLCLAGGLDVVDGVEGLLHWLPQSHDPMVPQNQHLWESDRCSSEQQYFITLGTSPVIYGQTLHVGPRLFWSSTWSASSSIAPL